LTGPFSQSVFNSLLELVGHVLTASQHRSGDSGGKYNVLQDL